MNHVPSTSRDRRFTLRASASSDCGRCHRSRQTSIRTLASSATSDSHSFASSKFSGFTLVELLVVIAVLLILIVMTVTAIDFTFTSERVRSGARQVQSALEGARDRAIFAREPRGLRLFVDPNDPRIVTSMVYVGGSKNWSQGQIRLERKDFNEDANNNGQLDAGEDTNGNGRLDGDGVADFPQDILIVRGDAICGWNTLKDRGFLGLFEDRNLNGVLDPGEDLNGNGLLDLDAPRIKIPADDNGSWYTVLTYRLSASSQVLELLTPYRDPGTSPPNQVVAFTGTGPSTYILELPPRILPDAQPILLPEGICIDLDASYVPADWRPGPGSLQTTPYSAHMDILFSARGVVTGPVAATGLVHLYLAERKDVTKVVDIGLLVGGISTPRPPVNRTVQPPQPPPLVPGQNQFGPQDPIGQRLVISIFTQTGKVSSHQVDLTDAFNNVTGVSGSDGYADNPFHYATQGEASSQ